MQDYRTKNHKAFEAVLEEYEKRKSRSLLSAKDFSNDGCAGTPNPARPNPSDFICDVESQIRAVIHDDEMIKKFVDAYLLGKDTLTKSRRHHYEQRIGAAFIKNKIWPVKRYFTTERKRYEQKST